MGTPGCIECLFEFQEYCDGRILGLLQIELVYPIQYPAVALLQVAHSLPTVSGPAMRFIVNFRPAKEAAGDVQLVENILGPIRDQGKILAVALPVTVAACIQDNEAVFGATAHCRMAGRARRGRSLIHQCSIMFALNELRPLVTVALPASFRLLLIMHGTIFVAHRQNTDVCFLR